MKLIQLGSNQSLLTLNSTTSVLFSYETPVAGHDEHGYFRTDKRWSSTTMRHISNYLHGAQARTVQQEWINGLVGD